MPRREALRTIAAAGLLSLFRPPQIDGQDRATGKARITEIKVYVVVPELPRNLPGVPQGGWQWTFVQIDTDQGVTGWGEASHPGNRGAFITGRAVLEIRDALIGEDTADIERIWHKLYRGC
jgi:L-alanine-DL-glutamate epimerase-like enolase superfamily enzyme